MSATPPPPQEPFAEAAAIEELVSTFLAGRLPRARWTHRAHLVVGLWHRRHHPSARALQLLRRRIRAHNTAVGTPNSPVSGYHETLTRFFLQAIAAFDTAAIATAGGELPLPEAAAALLASPLADPAYPLRFYSAERLFSAEARRAWLPPDRSPPDGWLPDC